MEEEMATHSSILAWRIPGTEQPGGLPSMGSHRVGHDWSDLAAAAFQINRIFKWKKEKNNTQNEGTRTTAEEQVHGKGLQSTQPPGPPPFSLTEGSQATRGSPAPTSAPVQAWLRLQESALMQGFWRSRSEAGPLWEPPAALGLSFLPRSPCLPGFLLPWQNYSQMRWLPVCVRSILGL